MSGEAKATVLTVANQPGVRAVEQARDTAALGLYNFTEGGLQLKLPDYATGENQTATLFNGGRLIVTFPNSTIQPNTVSTMLISKDAAVVRDLGTQGGRTFDFTIPTNKTLPAGQDYAVLVTAHFKDLGPRDLLMGTNGHTVTLPRVTPAR
jgi:hypothetical protein